MANTTNFGWETPDDTDLVKDGALAMRTLGNAIDTSLVDLKGGTTGQVLSKNTNTDMDFTWVTTDDANAIQNAIVDAKGDLIAASANDTPARLAVGANGETLIADTAETTGLRYNPPVGSLGNPVINGGMDIWQRGTSFTSFGTTSTFTADRYYAYRGDLSSTITVSRQSSGLTGIQFAARVQRNSGNTSTSAINFIQDIESVNSIPFAGKTVTFSFYARAGANYSAASSNLRFSLISGTGTDQRIAAGYTGSATLINTTAALTTSWQRFTATATVGTTATQLGFFFEFVPVGTAGANDWFEVTGVQIDLGTWTASTAPTFRRSGNTLAGELMAAQRYFQKSFDASVAPANNTANVNGEVFAQRQASSGSFAPCVWVPFRVSMRTAPSVTLYNVYSGTAGQWSDGSTVGANARAINIGENGMAIDNTATVINLTSAVIHYAASSEL